MSAALAVQKAIMARLTGATVVTALVPSTNILDRNALPAPDPSIIVGEDQEIDENRIARDVVRVVSTIHVWKRGPGLVGVKAIAGAIRAALHVSVPAIEAPYRLGDCYVSSTRYLRDPDGETAHGVVTVDSLVRGMPS